VVGIRPFVERLPLRVRNQFNGVRYPIFSLFALWVQSGLPLSCCARTV